MRESVIVHTLQSLEDLPHHLSSLVFWQSPLEVFLQIPKQNILHGNEHRVRVLVPTERPNKQAIILDSISLNPPHAGDDIPEREKTSQLPPALDDRHFSESSSWRFP